MKYSTNYMPNYCKTQKKKSTKTPASTYHGGHDGGGSGLNGSNPGGFKGHTLIYSREYRSAEKMKNS